MKKSKLWNFGWKRTDSWLTIYVQNDPFLALLRYFFKDITPPFTKGNLSVHPTGFEPVTTGAEIQSSIQLSHGCINQQLALSCSLMDNFNRVKLQGFETWEKELFYGLVGNLSITYSAKAVMVKLGFTPKFTGTIDPSTT